MTPENVQVPYAGFKWSERGLSRLQGTYSMGSGVCGEVLPASVVFMGLESQIVTLNNSFLVLGAGDVIIGSKAVTGHT